VQINSLLQDLIWLGISNCHRQVGDKILTNAAYHNEDCSLRFPLSLLAYLFEGRETGAFSSSMLRMELNHNLSKVRALNFVKLYLISFKAPKYIYVERYCLRTTRSPIKAAPVLLRVVRHAY
jgi:hypothetical protein